MARGIPSPPPKPPTISKSEGRRRFIAFIERGDALLANRPLKDGQHNVWSTGCIDTIEAVFGEDTSHTYTFVGPTDMTFSDGPHSYSHHDEQRDAEQIARRIDVLRTLLEQIDLEIEFEQPPALESTFWADIHPAIARVAKARYDAGHFADSVEAALKEINTIVKEHVRRNAREELDGAALMLKAFSPKSPVVVLDDLNTESGRSVQQGYMQIYAGAMIGIRNPNAHANIVISDVRARHFLYLASLLTYRFDERL